MLVISDFRGGLILCRKVNLPAFLKIWDGQILIIREPIDGSELLGLPIWARK